MKYKMTEEKIETSFGTLAKIQALKNFGDVKAGEFGGFIFCEENLSQSGDAQVYGNAWVYGNARVYGNAWVYGNARVYGNAQVSGNARVYGDARVWFDTLVTFLSIGPLGEHQRYITIAQSEVAAGCFLGSHAEFWKEVQEKYGEDGGDYGRIKSLLNLQ